MRSNGHYDAIVVGAGVIGASIAYELSLKGMKVALIEKNQPASGSSGAAGGMLAAESEHFESKDLRKWALYSRSLYNQLTEQLYELTGIHCGLRSEGFLLPIDEQDLKQSHTIHSLHTPNRNNNGNEEHLSNTSPLEWWNRQRLALEEPYIHAEQGMLYNPAEQQLIPALLNEALVMAAIRLGAVLYRQTEVTRLLREHGNHGRVTGVVTEQGIMYGERVILSSGIGSGRLLETEGYRLPFLPVKGELLEIRTPSCWLNHTIYGNQIYIIPKQGNRIWIGATSKPGRTDTIVEAGAVPELLFKARQYIPAITNGELVRCWAGVRPGTPDELPYLGRLEPIPGVWMACGHYRNGILLAAGTGRIMADAVAADQSNMIPTSFSPERALQPLSGLQEKEGGTPVWN
ncbi:glycine oxidase ThiO [Paenibacillus bovis]|uniref:glycine oxidase n=1 Tax=Paenibacillus bovis TaxID=1616788 RepID=A0A172ZIJ5_9BACL|nr:glycine oxidase ThiO [Paenibacillus bovis]ANF97212.1 glycine oxidase ThiO [Paenibacillus bovis]